jgi:hypothetical protein
VSPFPVPAKMIILSKRSKKCNLKFLYKILPRVCGDKPNKSAETAPVIRSVITLIIYWNLRSDGLSSEIDFIFTSSDF